MSEVEPSKSHATSWIVGVVLAVVLYLGSALPVERLLFRHTINLVLTHRLPVSLGVVHCVIESFYAPASWVWGQLGFKVLHNKWDEYWFAPPIFLPGSVPAPPTHL